jgi:hypothetical protein
MNFSASNLIKQSAKQMVYKELNKRKKAEPIPERMLRGQADAEEKAEHLEEMRGTYVYGGHLIHFSWDEVFDADDLVICMERKYVEGDPEDWYFHSSILQTAFYGILTDKVADLYTAKFARKRLKTQHVGLRGKAKQYVLCFGDEHYDVLNLDSNALLGHFIKKAIVVDSLDYDTAVEWDSKYKHKEWDKLSYLIEWNRR